MLFAIDRIHSLSGLRKSSTIIMLAFLSILLTPHMDSMAQSTSTGTNCPSPDAVLITEYAIPTADSEPSGITVGPDGAVWFGEDVGSIGRITVDGEITEYPLPDAHNARRFPVAGPDGAIWFTDPVPNVIGRITPEGDITTYAIPSGVERYDEDLNLTFTSSYPVGIALGADQAFWFTELDTSRIGRLSMEGEFTEYPTPTADSGPVGITLGSDGAIWFIERSANQIGRITTDGAITEYPVPTPGSFLLRITGGPDGAVWFTEFNGNKIGRISTDGEVTEFVLPTAESGPVGITAGSDTAIWFTEFNTNKIGCITPEGEITEYEIPTPNSVPFNIAIGADGTVWFTENASGKIGRLQVQTESAAAQTVFSSDTFALPMSISFDSDWHILDDFTDLITVKHNQEDWHLGFNLVTHAEVADPVSRDRMPFPEDFLSWIQSNPDFQTDQPIEVVVGGIQGLQIDTTPVVTTRKAFLYLSGTGWNVIPTPERWRFILFDDINGEKLLVLIIAPAEHFDDAVQNAQPILDSVIFSRGFHSSVFELPLSLNYSLEWYIQEEHSDVVTLRMYQEPTVDLEFLRLENATIAGPEAPYSPVPFPDNFVNWIQAHDMFQVNETRPVLVDGFEGTEIDVTTTAACGNRRDFIWFSRTGWVCGEGEFLRFIYLDNVQGEPILIMITGGILSGEDLDAGLVAAQAILDSVVFSR